MPERVRAPTLPTSGRMERVFNVQRWTRMERGGLFAATEELRALVGDIRAFFRRLRLGRF